MLGINRLFVAEHEQGGFEAFLLAPVDRTTLLFAKASALFCYLAAVELVAVPAFAVLLLGPSPGPAFPELLGVLAAGQRRDRRRGHAGLRAGHPDARAGPHRPARGAAPARPRGHRRGARDVAAASEAGADPVPGKWLAVLALYDVVFALLAYAVFDYLLED